MPPLPCLFLRLNAHARLPTFLTTCSSAYLMPLPVQGAVIAAVAGTGHQQRAVVERDRHVGADTLRQGTLGPLHGHAAATDLDIDTGWHCDGFSSDTAHRITTRSRAPRRRRPPPGPGGR